MLVLSCCGDAEASFRIEQILGSIPAGGKGLGVVDGILPSVQKKRCPQKGTRGTSADRKDDDVGAKTGKDMF